MPIIRSPSNCRCSLWFPYECGGGRVSNRPRMETRPPPHSYGNQRLKRQFRGLLMMGIIMPETCWAAPIRQNNKFYDWLLHLVGCFIWASLIFLYFYYADVFCVVRLGISSKTCSPDGEVRVVYVLICYCPFLCGLSILVILDFWEWCALVLCVVLAAVFGYSLLSVLLMYYV
jgi:hypothetical protein